jgi:hypothetical protein
MLQNHSKLLNFDSKYPKTSIFGSKNPYNTSIYLIIRIFRPFSHKNYPKCSKIAHFWLKMAHFWLKMLPKLPKTPPNHSKLTPYSPFSQKSLKKDQNWSFLTQNHSNQLIFGSKCSKMLQISSFSYQNDRKTLKNTPRMSKTHPIFPIPRHTRIRLHRPRRHCHRRHCRIQPRSVRFIGGNGGFWDEFRAVSGDFEGFYR